MYNDREEFKKVGIVALSTFLTTVLITVAALWWGGFLDFGSKKLDGAVEILKSTYYKQVDESELLDAAISGMTESLKDPYTVYYDKEQMKAYSELFQKTEDTFVGIGVRVVLENDGLVTVVEPIEGSPAEFAGIKPGDKIIKVDDKDVRGLRDDKAVVDMMKGPENSGVRITVFRKSEDRDIEFDLIRKRITSVLNIRSRMLDNNIAYIRLAMFDDEISHNFKAQLDKLISEGAKGLIIDLRNNPGGIYGESVKIADRILPEGTIVYTEDRQGRKEIQKSDSKELNIPIAVLVNGNSASASEVLSGAIKDYKKGILIGTKTFGKGLVQTTYNFKDGSGIKVTISRYFTPLGTSIHGIGIEPDIKVELDEKYKSYPVTMIPLEDDLQLQKGIEVIKNQIS